VGSSAQDPDEEPDRQVELVGGGDRDPDGCDGRHRLNRRLAAQDCALSPVEMAEALGRGQRGVSRASVCRILEELEHAELVARIEVGQGIVRYEPLRQGTGTTITSWTAAGARCRSPTKRSSASWSA
jgi:hypothetical protein